MMLRLIKQAYHSLVSKDSDNYPIGQATENEAPQDYIRMSVYGICSNPSIESHVLLLSMDGQESIKFGFPNDFWNRLKDLKEGEAALVNTKTGSYILMKEDGSIEANADFKVVGDLTIDGNIESTGDITADGDITGKNVEGTVDVTGGGISLKLHTHSGVTTGGGSSGPPNP